MVGQAKVIIRAEIQHAFTVHYQPGSLGRTQRADTVKQASLLQAIEFLLHPIQSVTHFFTSCVAMIWLFRDPFCELPDFGV
jgi:hypothetical protein